MRAAKPGSGLPGARRSALLLPATLCALMFMLGFESGGFQLALLRVRLEFGIDNSGMGGLVTAQFAAILIAPLLVGPLADRFGKKRMLLAFTAVFAAGCLLAAATGGLLPFVLCILLVGAGLSVCESLSSAALTDNDPAHAGRAISMAQFMFSMGAMASPLLLDALMQRGATWRAAFLLTGLGTLALLVPLFLCRFAAPPPARQAGSHSHKGLLKVLFSAGFLALFLSLFSYAFYETGVTYFADSFFAGALGAERYGAWAISGYWLAQAAIRLFFAVKHVPPRPAVAVMLLCCGITGVLLCLVRAPVPALVLCVVAGLSSGAAWPLLVGMAAASRPGQSGAASSLMETASGLGGLVAPVLMGIAADAFGLRVSFGLAAAVILGASLLFTLGTRRLALPQNNTKAS